LTVSCVVVQTAAELAAVAAVAAFPSQECEP
jgi:hypothetical protein